jgi:hypothetical protein
MKRTGMTTLAVTLLAATTHASGPPAQQQAKPNPKPDTFKFCGIDWHTKLDPALKQAPGDKRTSDRPVMVLRVLGDLKGSM